MKNFLFRLLLVMVCLGAGSAQAQDAASSRPLTSKLNITGATVVKAAPGVLITFNVTTAGAQGSIYDTNATGSVAAGNLIAAMPATVGTYYMNFPFFTGLVVVPGSAQVVSVSLQ